MPDALYEQIAIDGPAASGKSTVAKRLATLLRGSYVNTGEMYRAVAWLSAARGLSETTPDAVVAMLGTVDLRHRRTEGALVLEIDGAPAPTAELRRPDVAVLSSKISAIPGVRAWLLARQRDAAKVGLIVMEGRDIGTVIFPQARHKFFLTASPEERARRRLLEESASVDADRLAAVAREIAERDMRDTTRTISPLKPAADAVLVDTTGQSIDKVVERLAAIIRQRWSADDDFDETPK